MMQKGNYYLNRFRNKAIDKADSYVPLGYKLGDFTEYLKVKEIEEDNGNNDILGGIWKDKSKIEIENLKDGDTGNSNAIELLSAKICNKVIINRQNKVVAEHVQQLSEDLSDFEPDVSTGNTTIEMNVPYSIGNGNSEPLCSQLVDTDVLSSGLSVLNLALNSEVVTNNIRNGKKFMAEGIGRILESVEDDQVLDNIFKNLNDSSKYKIMHLYLSDNELVHKLKDEKMKREYMNDAIETRREIHNTKAFTSDSLNFNVETHMNSNFDDAILRMTKFCLLMGSLIYESCVLPVLIVAWSLFLELNERFHLFDLVIRVLIGLMFGFISLFLRIIMVVTKAVADSKGDRVASKNSMRQRKTFDILIGGLKSALENYVNGDAGHR